MQTLTSLIKIRQACMCVYKVNNGFLHTYLLNKQRFQTLYNIDIRFIYIIVPEIVDGIIMLSFISMSTSVCICM